MAGEIELEFKGNFTVYSSESIPVLQVASLPLHLSYQVNHQILSVLPSVYLHVCPFLSCPPFTMAQTAIILTWIKPRASKLASMTPASATSVHHMCPCHLHCITIFAQISSVSCNLQAHRIKTSLPVGEYPLPSGCFVSY